MNRFERWRVVGYYAFGVAWLAALVALVLVRVRTSSDSGAQLASGLIVLGCVLSVGIAVTAFTTWPAAAARAELRRRCPDSLVENVQRNPLKPFLVSTSQTSGEGGWYRTVVADGEGLSIWRRVDRSSVGADGDRLDQIASIRWSDVTSIQTSLSGSTRPVWSVDVSVRSGSSDLELNLVFSAEALGGLFPARIGDRNRLFKRLESLRAGSHNATS